MAPYSLPGSILPEAADEGSMLPVLIDLEVRRYSQNSAPRLPLCGKTDDI
jgi:hypothetical protein